MCGHWSNCLDCVVRKWTEDSISTGWERLIIYGHCDFFPTADTYFNDWDIKAYRTCQSIGQSIVEIKMLQISPSNEGKLGVTKKQGLVTTWSAQCNPSTFLSQLCVPSRALPRAHGLLALGLGESHSWPHLDIWSTLLIPSLFLDCWPHSFLGSGLPPTDGSLGGNALSTPRNTQGPFLLGASTHSEVVTVVNMDTLKASNPEFSRVIRIQMCRKWDHRKRIVSVSLFFLFCFSCLFCIFNRSSEVFHSGNAYLTSMILESRFWTASAQINHISLSPLPSHMTKSLTKACLRK